MKILFDYNAETHELFSNGQRVDNGVDLVDYSPSFATAFKAKLRTRQGSVNADAGSVIKTKRSVSFLYPTVVDGITTVNVGRVELEFHPNMSSVDIQLFKQAIADAVSNTSAQGLNLFFKTGNTDTDNNSI